MSVAFLRETELALMNAPFEAGGWEKAIGMVASATGSGAAHLAAFGGPLLLSLDMFVGREADRIDDYFSSPELCGASNWRIGCIGDPMTIQHERHYKEMRALGGTGAYDDAVAQIDMELGCQTTLLSDERNFLGLALIRSRREGPTDDIVYRRFKHLIGHVQRSVRVQLALDGEAGELMVGEWAGLTSPMLVIDRFGGLCALTQSAEVLFEDDGPLSLRGLSIAARVGCEDRHFQSALARLLRVRDETIGPHLHQMNVGRTDARPDGRWRLSLLRLPRRPHGLGFDPHLLICAKPSRELFEPS